MTGNSNGGDEMNSAIIAAAIQNARIRRDEREDISQATETQVAEAIGELARKGYEGSEMIVEPLRDYLSGYGVCLGGPAGIGKTFLMKCLRIKTYTAEHLVSEYGRKGIGYWFTMTDGYQVCIDDIGAESVSNHYGVKEELIKSVIAHREMLSVRTCLTTNLRLGEIAERYGDRTVSRIRGMCKVYWLEGISRRWAKVAATKEVNK
jgi:DNA replication protein DnaC